MKAAKESREILDVESRERLEAVLGSMDAVLRIEADCLALLAPYRNSLNGDPRLSASALRDRAAAISESAIRFLKVLEDEGGDIWGPLLCAGTAYESVRARTPWLWHHLGEDAWADLKSQLQAVAAASGRERDDHARGLKAGVKMPAGLAFLGTNLCHYLEREGVKRSSAERSQMVKAVRIVLEALGISNDPRAFVRTILKRSSGG